MKEGWMDRLRVDRWMDDDGRNEGREKERKKRKEEGWMDDGRIEEWTRRCMDVQKMCVKLNERKARGMDEWIHLSGVVSAAPELVRGLLTVLMTQEQQQQLEGKAEDE